MSEESTNFEGVVPVPRDGASLPFSVQLLAKVLLKTASDRGVSEGELAQKTKLTWGFFRQLERGMRQDYQLSAPLMDICAEYLGEPWWLVQILAGYLKASDQATLKSLSGMDSYDAVNIAIEYAGQAGIVVTP